MVVAEGEDVALVPFVQLDDLELREQQLGQRDRVRMPVQSLGDRERMALFRLMSWNVPEGETS